MTIATITKCYVDNTLILKFLTPAILHISSRFCTFAVVLKKRQNRLQWITQGNERCFSPTSEKQIHTDNALFCFAGGGCLQHLSGGIVYLLKMRERGVD